MDSWSTATEAWQLVDRFLDLRTPWLTLVGEHLRDPQGQVLDYWRVEKEDSVIILPLQHDRLMLVSPTYRPGLGQATLDFPGGRRGSQTPETAARSILQRELGVSEVAIAQLQPLNPEGWAVNSSFSNQRLYGFVAYCDPNWEIPPDHLGATYPATPAGIQNLLQMLTCLQCRALLLEWWITQLPL